MTDSRDANFFLGIDGGGSKTSCVIGDKQSILGRGYGGPSNIVRVGEAQAEQSLREAISQACSSANIAVQDIATSCLGIAGAENLEIARSIRRIAAGIVSGKIEVAGDATIALHAAFGNESGVIVIAGTGSVAYGRNSRGETARAGGWGFAVSDEGSGHWIGRAAIAAAFRGLDEPDASAIPLLEAITETWKVETRDQLVITANSSPPPNFSALFPAVINAARGEGVALETLHRAGRELARLGGIVAGRLFGGLNFHAAMCGGVFANSAVVRDVFREELFRLCPRAEVQPNIADPAVGALEMARAVNPSSRKNGT